MRRDRMRHFISKAREALDAVEEELNREPISPEEATLYPAGPPPFGFQVQPRSDEDKARGIRKPLIENPKEQKIIARIRELRAEDLSFSDIAKTLNREGFRTRQFGKWHIAGVQRIYVNQGGRSRQ